MKISINEQIMFKPFSINIEIECTEDLVFWWAQLHDDERRSEFIKKEFGCSYESINDETSVASKAQLWRDLNRIVESLDGE